MRKRVMHYAAAVFGALLGAAVIGPAVIEPAAATPAPQAVAFEVASVKPAVEPEAVGMFCIIPCTRGERLTVEGNRVDIRFMSLHQLIVTAYGLKPYQLNGPEWMRSQRFDILATIPEGLSTDRVPEMLRTLLAERFKLSLHHDNREQPVYALVVGRNGSKLRESAADADAPVPEKPGDTALYSGQGDARLLEGGGLVVTHGPLGPIRGGRGSDGGMRFEFLKLTMPGLADLVAPHEDHPVVDMTGLPGAYYLVVEVVPPSAEGGVGARGGKNGGPPEGGVAADPGPRRDPLGDALFAAIDRAGLKLESRKAPVETVVIDHLEKTPTEN